MKKEVIIVPKDKCPLDVLAELEERTKSAWIFLNDSAYKKLLESACSHYPNDEYNEVIMDWYATNEYPATKVSVENSGAIWEKIISIKAEDIAFTVAPEDPEELFFLKMAE